MKFTGEQAMIMAFRAVEAAGLVHPDTLKPAPPTAIDPDAPVSGVCFECDRPDQIHNHHVVPRSLGGKKTVPLCEACHGKVHGVDFTNHGVLTKRALDAVRATGVRLGRSPGAEKPEVVIARHADVVSLLRKGKSILDIQARTGKSQGTITKVKRLMTH